MSSVFLAEGRHHKMHFAFSFHRSLIHLKPPPTHPLTHPPPAYSALPSSFRYPVFPWEWDRWRWSCVTPPRPPCSSFADQRQSVDEDSWRGRDPLLPNLISLSHSWSLIRNPYRLSDNFYKWMAFPASSNRLVFTYYLVYNEHVSTYDAHLFRWLWSAIMSVVTVMGVGRGIRPVRRKAIQSNKIHGDTVKDYDVALNNSALWLCFWYLLL